MKKKYPRTLFKPGELKTHCYVNESSKSKTQLVLIIGRSKEYAHVERLDRYEGDYVWDCWVFDWNNVKPFYSHELIDL